MTHILFLVMIASAASTGRFPLIQSCGKLLSNAVRGPDAIEKMEAHGGERGDARLIWPRPVIHGDDTVAIYDSAKASGVKLSTEGYHAYLGLVIGVYQARGTARQVAQFLKDLMFMKGREFDLVEWLPAEPEAKDDLWTEEDFRSAMKGNAVHEFRYSYDSDAVEAGRTLAIMRLWPSTYFSSRAVYLRLQRETSFVKLGAKTFLEAYREWRGRPSWVELDGEAFLFGDEGLLWELRGVRRSDLAHWEIDLKIDPRPFLLE